MALTVAVTGGTGFVGRGVITRHLQAGDVVRVLTRSPGRVPVGAQTCVGDLTHPSDNLTPFLSGADVLYHCAGEIFDQSRMHKVHVDGTTRLIAAARGRVGRWVQLSSVGAYGLPRDGEMFESSPECPKGTYEVTKTAADALVTDAARDGAFSAVVLRPCKILGIGMRDTSVQQMIGLIARGWFVLIGRPGASANYICVENVVHALCLCGTHPAAAGQRFNLSDHRSIEAFTGRIAEALQVAPVRWRIPEVVARLVAQTRHLIPGFPLTPGRIDGLTTRVRYPTAAIEAALAYTPVRSIEADLDEMVSEWQRERTRRHG